ncbi:hypothetical protein [Caulobacter endophyticus]|uniref:hypothetical protein n=1 Tax=Caulobacter endophyticus TaxID=2172652 RepID=UPI001304EB25|nr:hypothetical protein [Caulobacter endophyticus]
MSDRKPEPRIRALVTNDVVDYPHNDLANAAWFFRERLTKAFDNNEPVEGAFLDMIALVTMIAFSLEGYANFLGDNIFGKKWGKLERTSVKNKLGTLGEVLELSIDWDNRPYRTVGELIELRNMFAHPKPHPAKIREQILIGTDSELRKLLRNHRPSYEERLTWDFIKTAYDDVEKIWIELLHAAKIELHRTWSGGIQGIELIEVLDAIQDHSDPPSA